MCAGRRSVSEREGRHRRFPEVHFRSRGPGRKTANDNRRKPDGPEALVLSALKLATMSTAALAGFALRRLPSS